ncbi:MAG: hypothetical protein S4CHLAM2_16040 [Chlamydiales bacterium]|nr:hypothetical protein [Chlamydiales bacterium]
MKALFLIYWIVGNFVLAGADQQHILFEELFAEQYSECPYLNESNPTKQLILFSGTPGMGKTKVAKALEHHFRAIRVSADEARILLKKRSLDVHRLVDPYIIWSLNRLASLFHNHLIILDRSVDRTYDKTICFARQNGYTPFLVRLEVDKDIVKKRVEKRGWVVDHLSEKMKNYWLDYQRLGERTEPDFCFRNNTLPEFDQACKELCAKLESCMECMTSLQGSCRFSSK